MKITSFALTNNQYKKINKIARRKGNSMGSVLRDAIDQYLQFCNKLTKKFK